jgi:hypothetical protein
MEFSDDGKYFASTSGEVNVWRFGNGKLEPIIRPIEIYIAQEVHFDEKNVTSQKIGVGAINF